MIIDVFGLLPGAKGPDPNHRVATVTVHPDGTGTVEVHDPRRGARVQELFENDFSAFTDYPDGTTEFKAWSPEAIQQILSEELPSFSLSGPVRK